MSERELSTGNHLDPDALNRYRQRRAVSPSELLAIDAHIASCDSCYDAVRADTDTIDLPADDHLSYEELEAFVDGSADAVDRELTAAHAASCAVCHDKLTDLGATRDSLRSRLVRAVPRDAVRRPRT
ncbi:MAG TPA: hypothetical protein VE974_04495 [Thermoanaerobaculia bacterium]|nr:hypothetical protein [Thermoanaerobaculia bacterium]